MGDKLVTKFHLYAPGEPSVGIQSTHTSMDLMFDIDCNDAREDLREMLRGFFSELYDDGGVSIEFQDEVDALEEQYRQDAEGGEF